MDTNLTGRMMMAKNAPSKEISDILRRVARAGYSYERANNGHFRITRDGKPVRLPSGMPLLIAASPSTRSAIGSTIARLAQAGVIV